MRHRIGFGLDLEIEDSRGRQPLREYRDDQSRVFVIAKPGQEFEISVGFEYQPGKNRPLVLVTFVDGKNPLTGIQESEAPLADHLGIACIPSSDSLHSCTFGYGVYAREGGVLTPRKNFSFQALRGLPEKQMAPPFPALGSIKIAAFAVESIASPGRPYHEVKPSALGGKRAGALILYYREAKVLKSGLKVVFDQCEPTFPIDDNV